MSKPSASKNKRALWREKNREWLSAKNRRNRFMRHFGMTVEQYEALAVQQHGLCAICGNEETTASNPGSVNSLAVDHCHATGRIRGLICHRCNHVLGLMKDNVVALRAAALYVESADTGLRVAAEIHLDSDSIIDELSSS